MVLFALHDAYRYEIVPGFLYLNLTCNVGVVLSSANNLRPLAVFCAGTRTIEHITQYPCPVIEVDDYGTAMLIMLTVPPAGQIQARTKRLFQ